MPYVAIAMTFGAGLIVKRSYKLADLSSSSIDKAVYRSKTGAGATVSHESLVIIQNCVPTFSLTPYAVKLKCTS